MMLSLAPLLALLLVTVSTTAAQAQDTKKWTLLHSFNGRDFSRRGKVLLQVLDGSPDISVENDESCVDTSQIETMMSFGLYQLKMVEDGTSDSVLTTVPSCQLRRSNFRDELTVTLNSKGSAVSLAYAPLVSPLAPACETLDLPTEIPSFTSKINFETSTPGMVIPTILPPTNPQQGIKFYKAPPGAPPIPGVKPEGGKPQSFLFKYWYVILPLALMSFMGTGAPEDEAPAAGGAPSAGGVPKVGGAHAVAQAAAASGGESVSKQRRGKRN